MSLLSPFLGCPRAAEKELIIEHEQCAAIAGQVWFQRSQWVAGNLWVRQAVSEHGSKQEYVSIRRRLRQPNHQRKLRSACYRLGIGPAGAVLLYRLLLPTECRVLLGIHPI
jgi:hypothetical protein